MSINYNIKDYFNTNYVNTFNTNYINTIPTYGGTIYGSYGNNANSNYFKAPILDNKLLKLKEFIAKSIEEAEKQTKTNDKEQRDWNIGFAEALQEIMAKIEDLEENDV